MKRYIDFVQKPKKGQTSTEAATTFISVPEKKATPVRPAATHPTAAHPTATPHYKPDFGPIRKKPLAAPAARPTATSTPVSVPHPRRVVMDMTRPMHASRVSATPVASPAVKPVTKPVARPATTAAIRPAVKPVTKPVVKPAARPATRPAVKPTPRPVEKPVENFENTPDDELDNLDDFDSIFGVIEDYHPVNNPPKIAKRPLSAPGHHLLSRRQAKAEKQPEILETEEPENSEITDSVNPEAETKRSNKITEQLKAGKSPFIRTNSIEKRPLSNSVAPKKPVITAKTVKEEFSDPATIIEKPEKDAHIGIVVTVILTIVFGAAIGTAAFLLLPKH